MESVGDELNMCIEQWWNDADKGNLTYCKQNLSRCRFLHHTFHAVSIGIKLELQFRNCTYCEVETESFYRVYTKEWCGKLVVTPTEHQLRRLNSTTGRCSPPFSQECMSASQSCSSTVLDPTCCKRRQPTSLLATPFAGSNTMRFLSLGVR